MAPAHTPLHDLAENHQISLIPNGHLVSEVENSSTHDHEVPVIDLQGADGELRHLVVQQIKNASEDWGMFQVINHGVSESLMKRMQEVARTFFDLPLNEKWRFSNKRKSDAVDLFHGYGTKELGTMGALDCGDQLRHKTLPVSARAYEQWPTNPPCYRETEEEYIQKQDELTRKLCDLLSESLALERSFFYDYFGTDYQQTLVVNNYLPSPESNLTIGMQSHSDFSALTLLLQDVPGLQVQKDGEWISVKFIPNAYVVNLGDQIEIMTNGKYKSPEHRALMTAEGRMSIGAFLSPAEDTVVAPVPDLIGESDYPKYKARTYAIYRTEIMTKTGMKKILAPSEAPTS